MRWNPFALPEPPKLPEHFLAFHESPRESDEVNRRMRKLIQGYHDGGFYAGCAAGSAYYLKVNVIAALAIAGLVFVARFVDYLLK